MRTGNPLSSPTAQRQGSRTTKKTGPYAVAMPTDRPRQNTTGQPTTKKPQPPHCTKPIRQALNTPHESARTTHTNQQSHHTHHAKNRKRLTQNSNKKTRTRETIKPQHPCIKQGANQWINHTPSPKVATLKTRFDHPQNPTASQKCTPKPQENSHHKHQTPYKNIPQIHNIIHKNRRHQNGPQYTQKNNTQSHPKQSRNAPPPTLDRLKTPRNTRNPQGFPQVSGD